MNLETAYEEFLRNLNNHGYNEFDFIKFIRNYYFPRTHTQTKLAVIKEKRKTERDYSKYTFNTLKNLSKRRLIYETIKYLLTVRKVSVAEINTFGRMQELTPLTRPFVEKIELISDNYLNRYFSTEEQLLKIGNEKFAVYNQFGGSGFTKLCEELNKAFKIKILKQ